MAFFSIIALLSANREIMLIKFSPFSTPTSRGGKAYIEISHFTSCEGQSWESQTPVSL